MDKLSVDRIINQMSQICENGLKIGLTPEMLEKYFQDGLKKHEKPAPAPVPAPAATVAALDIQTMINTAVANALSQALSPKILIKDVRPLPLASTRETIAATAKPAPAAKSSSPAAATGGAGGPGGSSTTLKKLFSEAAAAASAAPPEAAAADSKKSPKGPLTVPQVGNWGDVKITVPLLDWETHSKNINWEDLAKSAFGAPFKNTFNKDNTVVFEGKSIYELCKSILDYNREHIDSILKLDTPRFTEWLQDENEIKYLTKGPTRLFNDYNLAKNTIQYMKFTVGAIVKIKYDSTKETSLSADFKLSEGEEPSDTILREVAIVQAMHRYILLTMHNLLIKKNVPFNSITFTTDSLSVSFDNKEVLSKFTHFINKPKEVLIKI
jgi:hypothetical protein